MKKRAELNKIAEELKKIEAKVKVQKIAVPNDPIGKELAVKDMLGIKPKS